MSSTFKFCFFPGDPLVRETESMVVTVVRTEAAEGAFACAEAITFGIKKNMPGSIRSKGREDLSGFMATGF